MDQKKLFINIAQAVALNAPAFSSPTPGEYSRPVAVHVARNTHNGNISHITLEFKGVRTKFLCVAMFDGFGNYGASVNGFVMPRMKLTLEERVLIALSVFEFLCTNSDSPFTGEAFLVADFEEYKEKFISEIKGGVNNLAEQYRRISSISDQILEGKNVVSAI